MSRDDVPFDEDFVIYNPSGVDTSEFCSQANDEFDMIFGNSANSTGGTNPYIDKHQRSIINNLIHNAKWTVSNKESFSDYGTDYIENNFADIIKMIKDNLSKDGYSKIHEYTAKEYAKKNIYMNKFIIFKKDERIFIVHAFEAEIYFHYNFESDNLITSLSVDLRNVILSNIPTRNNHVHAILDDNGSLYTKEIISSFKDIEAANYTTAQMKQFEHIVEDLTSSDPCGRLVILEGPPGTGKSYFVKGIIHNTEAFFLLIDYPTLSAISSPRLFKFLIEKKQQENVPIVLIIEDADSALLPRSESNMHTVSSLLNLCDGLLGDALNLRIIATTNAKVVEIDPALKRTGRMCSFVHIDNLSPKMASSVFNRITNKNREFTSPTPLSDIYDLAREESGHKHKNKKDRFGFL